MKLKGLHELAFLIGGLLPIMFTAVMYITFYASFFFTDYTIYVSINTFGEALLEFVLLPIMLAFMIYYYYFKYQQMKLIKGMMKPFTELWDDEEDDDCWVDLDELED